ncbi:MAG TPA: macro domain-containing protein [Sphingobacteriaceae bacterium]
MRLKGFLPINYRRLGATFLSIFGLLWLFIEPGGLFLPQWLNWGWVGYSGLVFFSLVIAVILNRPRRSFSRQLSSPDVVVMIKIGDLFDEPAHLVIGTNDVFDTELGEVIKPSSVQGQFLTRRYHGDQKRLDRDIEVELAHLSPHKIWEPNKPKGKVWRYPIGTTIVLGGGDKRYFLNAYGRMGNDLRVKATADDVWHSLSCLWEQVRLKGHGAEIAVPVIGSDLARTNLPRRALMQLIILSFIAASKETFVAQKLTIVIHPKDVDLVDLYALEELLNSTCF